MTRLRSSVAYASLLLSPTQPTRDAPELKALYKASLHSFSVIRSGIAIHDPTTGIQHPASHLADSTTANSLTGRSLAGGWYNAGDYGKWTMMTAISVSYMLHLFTDQQQHGTPDPDLLNNAAEWGLAWLLKMQDPDGGVRHKIDSGTPEALGQAWGVSPERDPTLRIAFPASTLDTADFSAVMYQASRVYLPINPARANQLRRAAQSAYAWLATHPHTQVNDPFYPDTDATQEVLWARCERAASGENAGDLPAVLDQENLAEVSWKNPLLLGIYSLARSRTLSENLTKPASTLILNSATRAAAQASSRQPFHVALTAEEYTWGSAERVLHRASLFVMAGHLRPSPLLHAAATDQLAWLLGNNAMQHSLVVGFGVHPVEHPYHWTYAVDGKLLPGWAVGGPNASPKGADPALLHRQQAGTPPTKCYVDAGSAEGSWASNEGQISEEAALLFVTGSLLHQ